MAPVTIQVQSRKGDTLATLQLDSQVRRRWQRRESAAVDGDATDLPSTEGGWGG
jgi:hypothetical protein